MRGRSLTPSTGAVCTPVYLTSTFVQSAPGVHQGYDYSRADNPTRRALEVNLASLKMRVTAFVLPVGVRPRLRSCIGLEKMLT